MSAPMFGSGTPWIEDDEEREWEPTISDIINSIINGNRRQAGDYCLEILSREEYRLCKNTDVEGFTNDVIDYIEEMGQREFEMLADFTRVFMDALQRHGKLKI